MMTGMAAGPGGRIDGKGGHGPPAGVRAADAGGAGHPLRPALVHRRHRDVEVGGDRAGRARGGLRGGHRLRRVGHRGPVPRVGVGHAAQARAVDLPGPAVAEHRRAPGHRAHLLRHPHPGRAAGASDPRFVLKRALDKAAQAGYTFYTHPEIEFYLFKGPLERGATPEPVDYVGYFDNHPAARRRTSAARPSPRWRAWASRWSSATTRAARARTRSTCATPTR